MGAAPMSALPPLSKDNPVFIFYITPPATRAIEGKKEQALLFI
jgi:hypothetical protein